MAKKNRVGLNAVIQSNLPDNTTDFITPALDREVEIDEIDSCFNLEDDTAFDVNYSPTTPTDWDVTPTEVKGGLDELAERMRILESIGVSLTTAYVDQNGNDTTAEVGVETKPFATFAAAISALPNSNAKIVALGGSYTENINLGAKSNFVLDIRGCNITGTGAGAALRTNGGATSNMVILAEGANISTSSGYVLELNAINGLVVGGIWTATSSNICVITTNQNRIVGSTFRNTSTGKCADTLNNGQFINCIFKSNTDTTINRTNNSVFIACIIENSIVSNFAILTSVTLSLFIDCGIKGRVSCGVGADFKGRFQGCKIEASGKAIGMQGDAQPFFYNCTISGTEDCIDMTLVTGASTSQSQFVDCKLFAGTGAIFLEPIYLVSGKKIYSVNNVYNKVFVPSVTAEQRVFEFNKTQITDFVVPPSITIT